MGIERFRIKISGIVQGVGFRPFIHSLAARLGVKGYVNNTGGNVIIDAEGERYALEIFVSRIKSDSPPLSEIRDISVEKGAPVGYRDFIILESSPGGERDIYISPDVAVCEDCSRELMNPSDRRFLYPFINCTNCGPRFTIVTGIPYDRANTTMKKFEMCAKCGSEYKDPSDRRYHAQPVSCHECGPSLAVLDSKGRTIYADDAAGFIRSALNGGKIVAVKGLGGYHLACDARNGTAVSELRKRKARDDKPFALMVKDCGTALLHCHVSKAEKDLLESIKRPIVLLKKRTDLNLPEEIAPHNPYLGLMLPYTPVHLLLFHGCGHGSDGALDTLVMTSGNRTDEPICYRDEDAVETLSHIADYFLVNDRDIHIRTDDSVTRVFRDRDYIVRRARGYVPMPVTCEPWKDPASRIDWKRGLSLPSVLACGGELKNTFCLNKNAEFIISHHIGDLENAETLVSFEEGIEHFKRIFKVRVDACAYDLHPEYLSTKYAQGLDTGIIKIPVQHHHAHIAACMAENSLDGEVIGVAFDGTGYGEDGNLWGGEFFTGGYLNFRRAAHLEYIEMPGGEKAVREPWRMAASCLEKAEGDLTAKIGENSGVRLDNSVLLDGVEAEKLHAISAMIGRKLNCPLTSGMGRVFDAVSSLLGIRSRVTYEGQAAVELEYIASSDYLGEYEFRIANEDGMLVIYTRDIFKGIIEDIKLNTPREIISSRFHESAAKAVTATCHLIRQDSGLGRVVLSGGVFQNMILLEKCVRGLEKSGFKVFVHGRVPSNDGGLSLGQAMVAIARLNN